MEGARSESFTRGSQLDNYGRFMLRQLFEPWAAELLARVRVRPGDHVLDVASGLAPVARRAAAAGPGGRVVASDISGPMLAAAAARAVPADPGRAPIEYLECPANAIAAGDDSFDVVPLDAVWDSADEVTAALFGTPFGPLVAALPAGQQRQVRDDLARRLGASADGVTVCTVSNVARGVN